MPEPLRPLPPRTALVSNPDARKIVQEDDDELQQAAERRRNESPAGFLKNVIDRPRADHGTDH